MNGGSLNGTIPKLESLSWRVTASAVVAAVCLVVFTIDRDARAASTTGAQIVGPSASESRGVSKAPPPQPINWDKVTQEATDLLSKYIQINTTNPPGNEIDTARMLKEKFLIDGIPATTWEPEHRRGVVAARRRGVGKHTKSVNLLIHMDGGTAHPKGWGGSPFSGAGKD